MSDIENDGSAANVGARIRELRRAAGMSQADLAAGRFTKQYVSQIERGAVRPSAELLDWLASRLGVERTRLETGLGTAELDRIRTELGRGRQLLDGHRHEDALAVFGGVRRSLPPGAPSSERREALRGEVWALLRLGRVSQAAEAIAAALPLAESSSGNIHEQAELAYLRALCRYTSSEIEPAQADFARALRLLDEAEQPDDRLRVDIHQWRSRCYRRERDWEAAREDIERALELCDATGDARRSAEVNLQASLVAERQGRWVLARRYAEAARDGFEAVDDAITAARALNNVAGLNHLLGNDELAIAQLRDVLPAFVAAGLDAEAGYVLSSLAEILRSQGALDEAGMLAAQAMERLEGRVDHLQELGTAQLVLARTQLEQGELDAAEQTLVRAEQSYARTESTGHLARAWMARGELELERQNDAEAARLYREAATALQPLDPLPDE